MKLNYSNKRTITTSDLFDACDPPLTFEVRTRPPKEWANVQREFGESGNQDVELAKRVIAFAFLTVSDGSNTYDIRTVEQVEQLAEAIDQENPGYGDEFLTTIAWGFINNHFTYLERNLGNSPRPLSQSNGNGPEKTVAMVS